MQRVRGAVNRVAGEVGDHQADRTGDHPHQHDRRALQDPGQRGGRGDADPPADDGDQRRAGGGGEPGRRGDRPHERGRLVGAVDHLRQPHRHEPLERDHAEAPEQLDADQGQQDSVVPDQPDALLHGARHCRTDAREPAAARARSRCSVIRNGTATRADHGQRRRAMITGSVSVSIVGNGSQRDQPAGGERADGDRPAEHGAAGRQAALELARCGSAASVASTYQASSGPLSSAR